MKSRKITPKMLFVSEKARIEELIDIQEYDNDELF